MKPHPRIRKTIKWGGAALAVLLVVVWIGSYPLGWDAECAGSLHLGGMIEDGRIFAWYVSESRGLDENVSVTPWPHTIETWSIGHVSSHVAAGASFDGNSPGHSFTQETFVIALWIPAVFAVAATALAFRLDTLARRRKRMNLCPTGGCHYDRTGLAAGAVCPECGTGSRGGAASPAAAARRGASSSELIR